MKKLRNSRGETLVEVLAAILISALSVTLLFGCVMATSEMDMKAQKQDDAHYSAFTEADAQNDAIEVQEGDPTPYVTITRGSDSATPPIDIYGGEGMFSYKRAGS